MTRLLYIMSLSRDSTNKLCFTFFFNHDCSYKFTLHYIYMLSKHVGRDGTKISSWRINITSRWRIKKLGISFNNSRGSSWPLALDARFQTFGYCSHRSVSCDFKDNFLVLVIFPLPPWKWWGINFHEPLKWKAMKGHGQWRFSRQVISTPFYDYSLHM